MIGLNAKLLKVGADFISDSLTHILNLSLCTQQLPDDWKKARVTPIYKGSGKYDDGNNFRPISVISYVSKIMERGVQTQFLEYLMIHKFISVDQSAYIKHHSTLTSLHKVIDDFYDAIDNDELTGICFLDLSKCFDSINHTILLHKLTKYGVVGDAHNWFKNYLHNRSQYVCLNGTKSEESQIKIGVPQGSVLGPILFLLYVNDLSHEIKHSACNFYADDSMLYYSDCDHEVVNEKLQNDLQHVIKWLDKNRLCLNSKKSGVMSIKSGRNLLSRDLDIFLNNDKLDVNDHVKYLGVNIDNELAWSKHVNATYDKLSPKVNLLRRLSKILPKETLIYLYNSIIKPHFDYCLTVWGNCLEGDINKLQRLQNRIARIVSNNFDYNTPGITIVHELKWFNIRELRDFKINCLMFKCLNNECPNYLSDKFNLCKDVNVYTTRSTTGNNLCIPTFNKERCRRQAFSVKGPILFNELPGCVKDAPSFSSFKSRYKKMFM